MASTENKVRFNLSEIHYATATEGTDGSLTYSEWKDLPRGVSLDVADNSNTVTKYADNVLLYSKSIVSSKTITLNVSQLSDDFKKDILGYKATTGGSLIQMANPAVKPFALGFMVDGDASNTKIVYFKCTASSFTPGSAQTQTDTVTFADDSLTITIYPVVVSGADRGISMDCRSGDTEYDDLFTTTFTLPTAAA